MELIQENSSHTHSHQHTQENSSHTHSHQLIQENSSHTHSHQLIQENSSHTHSHQFIQENSSHTHSHQLIQENSHCLKARVHTPALPELLYMITLIGLLILLTPHIRSSFSDLVSEDGYLKVQNSGSLLPHNVPGEELHTSEGKPARVWEYNSQIESTFT